jgi:hypothetical protein
VLRYHDMPRDTARVWTSLDTGGRVGGLVCMSGIRVVSRESWGHQQARLRRQQRHKMITQLVTTWPEHKDDPLMVELLRGLALAQSLDDAHPIDKQGRCRRWRCTRRWLFFRRSCPTRVTLSFCDTADTVTLWFDLLNRLPNLQTSLSCVRAWLEPRPPHTTPDKPT